jgi:uncharacterized protein YegP (UPF0339 family)
MKAIIKQVTHGKNKGQWRFILKGQNGETVAHGETYKNKGDMLQTLSRYFPNFPISNI